MDKPVKYVNTSEVMNTFERFFREVREGGKEAYDFRRVEEMRQALAGILDRASAAEVEPVAYGRWEMVEEKKLDDAGEVYRTGRMIPLCTHCRRADPAFHSSFPRCPMCGAHMEKEAGNGKAD